MKQIIFIATDEQAEALNRANACSGVTISDMIRHALKDYLAIQDIDFPLNNPPRHSDVQKAAKHARKIKEARELLKGDAS